MLKVTSYSLSSVTFLTILLFPLSSCSNNTVMDDGAYRTIGGGNPRNPHPSTPKGLESDPQFAFDTQNGFSADGDISYQGGIPSGSLATQKPRTSSHVQRYGNPNVIEKIAQISKIHCTPRSFNISTNSQSFWGEKTGTLTQCSYRFPEFCGGHQFSLLNYSDKEVLIYNQANTPYYTVDTLKGTSASKPGLWDKDDKLGSKASNMNYLFENKYDPQQRHGQNTPFNFGWVIKASYHDENQHGARYHQAIKETTLCF